jgi:nitrate/TMAO reductase-like tetraheme cytochrome c subunit
MYPFSVHQDWNFLFDALNYLYYAKDIYPTLFFYGSEDMKKTIVGIFLVLAGMIIAFPLFSMSYYTMVRTSTPQFCASCHEIQFAYNTWKTSTHVNNAQGFVADCMDCHLPAPHDTINFFYAKTFHGVKDLFVHFFTSKPYVHAQNRDAAYASFKNEQCQKCHRNILHIPDKRGAMLAHRDVLYSRPGYEKRCVDCHRNLVHNASPVYRYKEYQEAYRGLGL